jgi:hypothetical protein
MTNVISRITALSSSGDKELDHLLHPAQFYERPGAVVCDELLSLDERRAILAAWASDACAVESNPPLRQPPFAAAPVTFDEIMDALVELDRIAHRRAVARRGPLHASLANARAQSGSSAV